MDLYKCFSVALRKLDLSNVLVALSMDSDVTQKEVTENAYIRNGDELILIPMLPMVNHLIKTFNTFFQRSLHVSSLKNFQT